MFTKPKIDKILFATDLSKNAEHAFAYAAALAEAFGARVTFLHVLEELTPNAEVLLAAYLGYGDIEELRQNSAVDLIARIKARIEQFCAEASDRMPECRFVLHDVMVERGKPVEAIRRHAATGGYDALVMGHRGHGLVREALLGGTSRKVLNHCPIPVFVVPMHASHSEASIGC